LQGSKPLHDVAIGDGHREKGQMQRCYDCVVEGRGRKEGREGGRIGKEASLKLRAALSSTSRRCDVVSSEGGVAAAVALDRLKAIV